MGAPEILFLVFLVGIPAALVWCAVNLGRWKTDRRVTKRWEAREQLSPEDEEFWRKR